MKIKNLSEGQKVHMKLLTFPEDVELDSKILRVEKDRLHLAFPEEYTDKMFFFREGQEVELSIYASSRVIIMVSLVIDTPYESSFSLELNDEFLVIQRRQYVRIDLPLNVSFFHDNKLVLNTKTINISGGGFKLESSRDMVEDKEYRFSLKVEGYDLPVTGYGIVLRNLEENGQFVSMFKFTEITEDDRNKIVKLCLEHEMKTHQAKKEDKVF